MSTENLPPYTVIEPLGGALSGACHVVTSPSRIGPCSSPPWQKAPRT